MSRHDSTGFGFVGQGGGDRLHGNPRHPLGFDFPARGDRLSRFAGNGCRWREWARRSGGEELFAALLVERFRLACGQRRQSRQGEVLSVGCADESGRLYGDQGLVDSLERGDAALKQRATPARRQTFGQG